ncbi:MAG: signal peptidase I [Hyphomicrobiaceae bacterium]
MSHPIDAASDRTSRPRRPSWSGRRKGAIASLVVLVLLLLPNVGPILRPYYAPSTSMVPTLVAGQHFMVSRVAYGYSRNTFDLFDLPISGRWPDWQPSRGDVIVFRAPFDHKIQYVKRVVGLPGDRVQLVGGRLSINGRLVPRTPLPPASDPLQPARKIASYRETLPGGVSYTILEMAGDTGPLDSTPEVIVPPRHLFLLGDNRDNSVDSRLPHSHRGIGLLPVELVIGRMIVRF